NLVENLGSENGTGSAARFYWPLGITVDNADKVYVADTRHNAIRLGTPVFITQPACSRSSWLRLSNGQFQFVFTASTNQLVLIQAASLLSPTDWITLQSVTLLSGRMTITVPWAYVLPTYF